MPSRQRGGLLQEAREVYNRDFDAQFPLSPSVHGSSGSSEAPSSEDTDEENDRQQENQERIGIQTWLRYRRDHPHACGHRPRPTPAQPFNFMGLPTETRCEILRLLLERIKEVTDVSLKKSFESYNMVPVDTRLFAVSRQMQVDAEVVFFRSNTIHVHVEHYDLPFFITNPPPSIRELRKVHLSISHYSSMPTQPVLAENLEKLADLLKDCKKLVQLKISQLCRSGEFPKVSTHVLRDSLEYFTRVRGVSEVVLTDLEPPKDDNAALIYAPEKVTTRLKAIMQSPKTE
ncbi:hypothetical protein HO133_001953 [Letharia lupina]|uniref:Uncharacterized protein n=1 Tax=Letharia lupina TaxID=560253 RepID=A0A8H6CE89_9LECA|nr:uncharacterized protein HO133_001953 [Letharia lupina]KAF6221985.1 hypothetical protein HO133_001953 [Letharia lupina]